ncbi:MAG: methylmalonyl-CoA epimerase [Anaerolineales bacterium]
MAQHKINHIAVAVPDVHAALGFWRDALGLAVEREETNAEEAVQIAFLRAGESHIELLQPTDPDGALARFLAKRGAGLHHICLEVADINASLAHLRAHGAELITEVPKTRPDGVHYAFIHPRSTGGVLVELYELPEQPTES